MRASLIVAAGGSGSRFRHSFAGSALKPKAPSKLFMPLAGKPVLARTVSAFQNIPAIRETVIAVPQGAEAFVRQLAKRYAWKAVKIVRGGKTRAESVWKALRKTHRSSEWVLVHDGARPLITEKSIQKLLEASKTGGVAVLARRVTSTVKEADARGRVARTLNRDVLFEAETPQMVRRRVLEAAYKAVPKAMHLTDEASILEAAHQPARLVAHEDWNPKITTFKDLELAEAYLAKAGARPHTGFGRDTHRLVEGRKMILGGVRIPFHKGPLGHSDGDALLHAISDAILGAAGLGDIGEWFSDRDPKNKNISSRKILKSVAAAAREKGWRIDHVDTVIVLEKPRLGAYKQMMGKKIAADLGLALDAVSIKAKTMEGLGPEGEGRAVTCEALVSVSRAF